MRRSLPSSRLPAQSLRSVPSPDHDRLRGERGSSLVLALLILFLLTLLGLALTLVTSTESMIAANERLTTQSFYAADSGLDLSAVRIILVDDTSPMLVQVNGVVPNRATRREVLLEDVGPLIDMPCNLCSLSAGSGYETDDYGRRAFSLIAEGRRASVDNSIDARTLVGQDEARSNLYAARRTVQAVLDIQPLARSGEIYKELERRAMFSN